MRSYLVMLPLVVLSGCVASVDAAVRARAAQDLSCPENEFVVEPLGNLRVEVIGCGVAARYVCPVSADPGRGPGERICIRETEPLKRMVAGPEEMRTPAR
jgi:hypothetical protein